MASGATLTVSDVGGNTASVQVDGSTFNVNGAIVGTQASASHGVGVNKP